MNPQRKPRTTAADGSAALADWQTTLGPSFVGARSSWSISLTLGVSLIKQASAPTRTLSANECELRQGMRLSAFTAAQRAFGAATDHTDGQAISALCVPDCNVLETRNGFPLASHPSTRHRLDVDYKPSGSAAIDRSLSRHVSDRVVCATAFISCSWLRLPGFRRFWTSTAESGRLHELDVDGDILVVAYRLAFVLLWTTGCSELQGHRSCTGKVGEKGKVGLVSTSLHLWYFRLLSTPASRASSDFKVLEPVERVLRCPGLRIPTANNTAADLTVDRPLLCTDTEESAGELGVSCFDSGCPHGLALRPPPTRQVAAASVNLFAACRAAVSAICCHTGLSEKESSGETSK
ncbi:hypothetical protein R3P38DRAFT_3196538 [Favolaschia claudopus]|uniref:Uncharacterized protein n=1 Tax=Favolaschia claudopus TaxID=2862362 RepID=A0AAW0B7F2_9AGAR